MNFLFVVWKQKYSMAFNNIPALMTLSATKIWLTLARVIFLLNIKALYLFFEMYLFICFQIAVKLNGVCPSVYRICSGLWKKTTKKKIENIDSRLRTCLCTMCVIIVCSMHLYMIPDIHDQSVPVVKNIKKGLYLGLQAFRWKMCIIFFCSQFFK